MPPHQVHDFTNNDRADILARKKKSIRKAKKRAARAAAANPTMTSAVAAATLPDAFEMPPVARGARFQFRHFMVLLSFLAMVILPSAGTYWYLHERAADQYASSVGFSVRKEEVGSAVEILGSISQVSSGSSSDTDILYEFIQSQELVEAVEAKLGLREIYSKPENDPFFAFPDDGSKEELVSYWNRMVKIFYNGSNGLIQLRVQAFDPKDAQNIARAIFDESSLMINRLTAIARTDATKYANDELDLALERLATARQAVTAFRNETQIVDPNADLQGQVGLVNTLQQQLASAIIEQDLLAETTQPSDPRNTQAERRVSVIRDRIAQERKKFGNANSEEAEAYADLISRYERLEVEREFAERFYLSALQTYDAARAEGQRQSRYLAAYVEPTIAQTPQYPRRLIIFGLVTFFAFLIWGVTVLVAYSIKDRR